MNQTTSPFNKLFGQILIAKQLVKAEQINECLRMQAEWPDGDAPTLGEILAERGYITQNQIEMVLTEQNRRAGARRFGGYELLAKIGEGGMAKVFRARNTKSGEIVALKIVSKRAERDKSFKERFSREANVGLNLDHPNIVATKDAGEVHGLQYLALELIEGGSLEDRLKTKTTYAELDALQMIQDIALALEFAHGKGLIHRDIKPENILFDSSLAVKLTDFGLVKYADPHASHLTQEGITVGTPHYISPEQALSEPDIDIRADIYSLGATLYRLVTGKTPFQGASAVVIINKHLHQQLKPPDELNPNLSEGCVALIEKMMAKDRADRYESPSALIHNIDRVIAGKLPEGAPLAAKKSSVARSAVRAKKTKNSRRSTRAIPIISNVSGRSHTTGLRQPIKRSRNASRLSAIPAKPLFAIAAIIAVIVGGLAISANIGDATPETNPGQNPPPINPTKNIKDRQPLPKGTNAWTGQQKDSLWSTAGNWAGNKVPSKTAVVTFDDSISQPCVIDVNLNVAGIVLSKDFMGKLTLAPGKTLTVGVRGFHMSGGTFEGGDSAIIIKGDFNMAGGTFVSTRATLTTYKNFTISSGVFQANRGTVKFGRALTVDAGVAQFDTVEFCIPKSATLKIMNTLKVRDLILTQLAMTRGGVIEISGNCTGQSLGNGINAGGTIFRFIGPNIQKVAMTRFSSIEIDKPSGRLNFSGKVGFSKSWKYIRGVVATRNYPLQIKGGSATFDDSVTQFKCIEVALNSNRSLHVKGTVNVGDLLLISGHELSSGVIEISGNCSGTFKGNKSRGSATLKFIGNGPQLLSAVRLPTIKIDKSGGTLIIKGLLQAQKLIRSNGKIVMTKASTLTVMGNCYSNMDTLPKGLTINGKQLPLEKSQ